MSKQRITPYGIVHEAESDHQYLATFGTTIDESGNLTLRIKPAPAAAGTDCAQGPLVNGHRYVLPAVAQAGVYAECDFLIGNEMFVTPPPATAGTAANARVPETLWIKPVRASAGCEAEFTFAIRKYSWDGSATFPVMTAAGGGVSGFFGSGWLDLRWMTLEGELLVMGVGGAAVAFPSLEARGTNLSAGVGVGVATFRPLDASATDLTDVGAGGALLPALDATGAGLTGGAHTGLAELPPLLADGHGPGVGDGESVSAVLVLAPVAVDGFLATGYALTGDLTLRPLYLSSDNLGLNYEFAGAAVLPPLEAAGVLVADIESWGAALFPRFVIDGSGENDLLGDIVTGFAMVLSSAMNEKNAAVTDWETWSFNSLAQAGEQAMAAGPTGIYILEGPSDDGAAIGCEVRKVEFDLGSAYQKRPTDAFIRLRSDNPYDFTIYADGVAVVLPVDDDLDGIHGKKVNLPRGLRGRRLGVAISNTSGADLSLEKLDLQIEVLSRRART
jgi:hypothetical protein